MAQRPVRRTIETIDPMFFIPEGVDELIYDEDLSDNANYAEGTQEQWEIIIGDDLLVPEEPVEPPGPGEDNDKRRAPKILGIISQELRTLKNGNERVDVVLRVETMKGVDKYEFRISEA